MRDGPWDVNVPVQSDRVTDRRPLKQAAITEFAMVDKSVTFDTDGDHE